MNTEELVREIEDLPPVARREVMDFIAFLHQRYSIEAKASNTPLSEEPFVGMWSERADMADSTQWVRTVREREWG
jgi:hypothetical protein